MNFAGTAADSRAVARSIDGAVDRCDTRLVRTKKPTAPEGQQKSAGLRMVEKYRPRMSRLTDTERQKLMTRGLQMVYGNTPAAKPTHRG
jgi:hypothetical protein